MKRAIGNGFIAFKQPQNFVHAVRLSRSSSSISKVSLPNDKSSQPLGWVHTARMH